VGRQYIGNLGKVENGIVSVNAYGVVGKTLFPLMFKVFKPQATLLPEDTYKTKPQLALEIISELEGMGFKIEQVLADSLYGESSTFIQGLNKLHLKYVVAIRSNHKAWLNKEEVTYSDWQTFDRVFPKGNEQTRFIQEIICPGSLEVRYWKITSDFFREQKTNTWYLMTNLSGDLYSSIGNHYGFRNWIDYGFKQAKNELGWADFRVTNYHQIAKWWEIVSCAFLLISLQTNQRNNQVTRESGEEECQSLNCVGPQGISQEPLKYSQHEGWNFCGGWKSTLNNLRLIIQPYVFYNFLKPWLLIFDIPSLKTGFLELLNMMNKFRGYTTLDSG
jgi:SRSO17 transposase